MESIIIREKTTSPIAMQLKSNGNAIDISGIAYIRLDMIDDEKKTYRYTSVDSSTYLTIVTPSTGSIQFAPPDSTVFRYQKSPYKLYVWVFTTSSMAYTCPESENAEIKVLKEF